MSILASAKRVVSLQRQIKVYGALHRAGAITDPERDELVKAAEAEIARLRSQGELPLEGGKVGGSKAPR
ncbi:hypothetical protein [Microviridae sp.]|nr:hypothetical protein [Microviridae sp.]